MISHISRNANDVKGSSSFAASFLPSLFAQTVVHVQHTISHRPSIMSRTTRLSKALTAALYNECSTMTIETQKQNTKYDNIVILPTTYSLNILGETDL